MDLPIDPNCEPVRRDGARRKIDPSRPSLVIRDVPPTRLHGLYGVQMCKRCDYNVEAIYSCNKCERFR